MTIDLEPIRRDYEIRRPELERFGDELTAEFERLIVAHNLALGVPLEHRVKSWNSITEKIERQSLTIGSVREMNDLVGLRAIFLFQRDLLSATALIEGSFRVDSKEDVSQRLGEAQFGYQSQHYVVRLPSAWLSVPSLSTFGDFRAEVQVRTLAQHIWAAASHKLQYKQETNIPSSVRRSISRVSALLETVDLEFERVLADRESYVSALDSEKPNAQLNVDLLTAIVAARLPAANKTGQEDWADLLGDLIAFGIDTSGKLEDLIRKHISEALRHEQRIVRGEYGKDEVYADLRKERLRQGVYYAWTGLVRTMLETEFGERWSKYIHDKGQAKRLAKS